MKAPAAQTTHSSALVVPVLGVLVPTGHDAQPSPPSCAWLWLRKVPNGHLLHAEPASNPAGRKYPATHTQSAAVSDPSSLNSCVAQAWYAAPPCPEYVLEGHVAHASLPLSSANVPAAHGTHAEFPDALEVPGEHAPQEAGSDRCSWPAMQEQFPRATEPAAARLFAGQEAQALSPAPANASGGHSSQSVEPPVALKEPAAQATHGPPSPPVYPGSHEQLASATPGPAGLMEACAGQLVHFAASTAPLCVW